MSEKKNADASYRRENSTEFALPLLLLVALRPELSADLNVGDGY